VVVGALLLLGDRGERYFMDRSIPVVASAREESYLCGNHMAAHYAKLALQQSSANDRSADA
jgi:hypothetical protein